MEQPRASVNLTVILLQKLKTGREGIRTVIASKHGVFFCIFCEGNEPIPVAEAQYTLDNW